MYTAKMAQITFAISAVIVYKTFIAARYTHMHLCFIQPTMRSFGFIRRGYSMTDE